MLMLTHLCVTVLHITEEKCSKPLCIVLHNTMLRWLSLSQQLINKHAEVCLNRFILNGVALATSFTCKIQSNLYFEWMKPCIRIRSKQGLTFLRQRMAVHHTRGLVDLSPAMPRDNVTKENLPYTAPFYAGKKNSTSWFCSRVWESDLCSSMYSAMNISSAYSILSCSVLISPHDVVA